MLELNKGWQFTLTDQPYGHLIDLDESVFKEVAIPHDFSIEQPYNQELGDGCTGYLVGGKAWYRKEIYFDAAELDKKVFLVFDGIYNRSNIYFNEVFMKFHPYGYSPCVLDVSEHIKEGKNLLAVHIDRTRHADSRWYTGSGIYRKVKLCVYNKTYIPVWGIKVHTTMDTLEQAEVHITTCVENEQDNRILTLKTQLISPEGKIVEIREKTVEVEKNQAVAETLIVNQPMVWDIYRGNTYKVIVTLLDQDEVIQTEERQFGIRYFTFDTDKGFFINGRHELIKGVCLHHDAGLVGAAVPKDVWRRRLETLIEGGVNAIRTAHNPASEEFLDLCDELGLLVQEEFYDEWDFPKDKRYNMADQKVDYITRGHDAFFKDYAKEDLQAVMLRDINHPSIIQWSIGNEIEWTYPKYNIATGYFGANANGNYFWDVPPHSVEEIRENISKLPKEQYEVGTTAQKLADWTREIDTTRPVVANCILPSASYESGYTDALDIVGFSYRQVVYERCHEAYPDKPIMGTENLPQWHEWKHVLEKEYISGIFLWTGIDYIGERGNVDKWPCKASSCGLLNVAGFKKPSYYMFKALWTETPSIYIATQTLEKSLYELKEGRLVNKPDCAWDKRLWIWHDVNNHYNYDASEQIVVEVYSNCDSVTLYQNDEKLETLYLVDCEDHIYKWCIPYKEGTLKAVGVKDQEEVVYHIQTAGAPVQLQMTVDKTVLHKQADEVCHVEVQLLDRNGHLVTHEESEVTFEFSTDVRFYGVDNGSSYFVGDHHSHTILTDRGKALMVFGATQNDEVIVSAKMGNKLLQQVNIEVK